MEKNFGPKGQPANKERFIRPAEAVIMFGGLLMFIALYMLFSNQNASEQRGYKNRAVICDMVTALGLKENPECTEPQVQKYRDDTAATIGTTGARNSRATMVVVCKMAVELKMTVQECAGIG